MVTAGPRSGELIQRLRVGVVVLGPGGEFIAGNDVASALLGVSREDFARGIVADPAWPVVREDGRPFLPEDRPVARALSRGEDARDVVMGMPRPQNGDMVWFLVNVDAVRVGSGIDHVVCTFVDITARQGVAQRLRTKEEQQQAIAELGKMALGGASLGEVREDAMRRVTEVLGVPFAAVSHREPDGTLRLAGVVGWAEEMVGPLAIVPSPDSQAGYTLLTRRPTLVEDTETETRFSLAPALFAAGISSGLTVVIPGEREPLGVFGVFSRAPRAFSPDDIVFVQSVANVLGAVSQRERIEAERDRALDDQVQARKRAERLAAQHDAILTQTAEGVVIADAGGTIVFVNDAARTLLGGDPTGSTVEEYAERFTTYPEEGEFAGSSTTGLGRALATGERVLGVRRRVQRPDGSEIVAMGNAVPLIGEDGSPLGAVAIYHDVTAEHEMSQQKSDFLSAAAHDLKGPLTTIKGHAQLLLRKARRESSVPSERIIPDAERIERTASRMANLITDLLDVTRIELGHALDLVVRPVDLRHLVEDVVQEMSADEPEGRLVLHVEGTDFNGTWDELRLRRVLMNLVMNASKYSPEESPIEIDLRAREQDGECYAELAVRDRGIGIPASELPRVFERYFRASNVPPHTVGSGIGLAGVRQIVEQHGGTVQCESEEGRGTTVRVRLPLDDASIKA